MLIVGLATSSSSQLDAIVLVQGWGYLPPRLPHMTSSPNRVKKNHYYQKLQKLDFNTILETFLTFMYPLIDSGV